LEAEDSGWQFLCNSGLIENEVEAQVWLMEEILALEPSLLKYINLPFGSTIVRQTKDSTWELTK
jgi:hypothetical protein